eukprot:3656154-Rhodomonas_salina.5
MPAFAWPKDKEVSSCFLPPAFALQLRFFLSHIRDCRVLTQRALLPGKLHRVARRARALLVSSAISLRACCAMTPLPAYAPAMRCPVLTHIAQVVDLSLHCRESGTFLSARYAMPGSDLVHVATRPQRSPSTALTRCQFQAPCEAATVCPVLT